jgi:hypothetical protein
MKKIIILLFVCFMAFEGFSQLQIGGGPALFACEKYSERNLGSIDYTLSAGYAFRKVDVGFEFVQNGYKSENRGKDSYHFYQYEVFGRYYPLRKKNWFIKGGTNMSDEYNHFSFNTDEEIIVIDERGTLLGLEGGFGFQDRLIKKLDLFLNVGLTYNYLFLLKDDYYFNKSREVDPFYALKVSFIYQFNFKKI